MVGKYNSEKHRRRSIRLQGYDYSRQGAYYVTICARNRECIFANPVGASLAGALLFTCALSFADDISFTDTWIGRIINNNWRNIPHEYGDVDIDEFIIMPNHLHGILIFSTGDKRAPARDAPTGFAASLGQIIGSFKSKCVNDCLRYIRDNKLNEIGKIWQRNFYEHIIRSDDELNRIRQYILNNPLLWDDDENNPARFKNINK